MSPNKPNEEPLPAELARLVRGKQEPLSTRDVSKVTRYLQPLSGRCNPWGRPQALSMSGSKAEVARAREALRSLIDLSGMSRREIEKRLPIQGSGVDLTRLLAGRFEIKLRHILDITKVIGLHPLEFFHLIFSEPEQRSPLLQRVEAVFAPGALAAPGGQPRARAAATPAEDLPQRLEQLVREVERLWAETGRR